MSSVIKLAFIIILVNVLKFSLSAEITFANSLDPNQTQSRHSHCISETIFENVNFENNSAEDKNHKFIQHLKSDITNLDQTRPPSGLHLPSLPSVTNFRTIIVQKYY